MEIEAKTSTLMKVKYRGEDYEFVGETSDTIKEVVASILKQGDISEFYANEAEFINKHIDFTVEEVPLKLWVADTTVDGWDTFTGAVVAGYTESHATAILEEFDDDFKGCWLYPIGIVMEDNFNFHMYNRPILTDFTAG